MHQPQEELDEDDLDANENFRDMEDDECDMDLDEAVEMKGIDKECNDMERTLAQNMIRRSVVRKKLNWSQQFSQGLSINNHRNGPIESIQKMF